MDQLIYLFNFSAIKKVAIKSTAFELKMKDHYVAAKLNTNISL